MGVLVLVGMKVVLVSGWDFFVVLVQVRGAQWFLHGFQRCVSGAGVSGGLCQVMGLSP